MGFGASGMVVAGLKQELRFRPSKGGGQRWRYLGENSRRKLGWREREKGLGFDVCVKNGERVRSIYREKMMGRGGRSGDSCIHLTHVSNPNS